MAAGGQTIRTTCAYCGVGCGIEARVTGEREVAIAGDPAHPANRGRLCSKGTHLGETVGLEGRLLHPEIGDGRADWRRADWDEAIAVVATRFAESIARHGPDSVAFYVSGQLLTEDYYVANKLMKGFIGSSNIDTNSRLCMASAVAAHNRAFGEDVVPCSYEDLDEADLVLLVGSNTAWCHPVIWQRIEAARAARGTKIVVIDPRRTETAEEADLHVQVAPDGDVALFNALLAALRERGCADEAFLSRHVDQPEGFWETLPQAEGGKLPAGFAELVDLAAAAPRMVTLFSQGANQSVCGTDKGNAIINLHLATGRIGKPGAGPFSITGQPNAMGGREVGGLASTLACHLGFSPGERDEVARFWRTDRLCAGPGLKAVELFEAVHDGRIKALWIMATNPAVSMPDAGFVREAIGRCPFVVVSDCIADTDTARLANVRLPALAWGEKDGTVTNSERMVSRQRPLFQPPGEARADWRIICDVARAMGHGEAFAFAAPPAIFREYAGMTALAKEQRLRLDLTSHAGIDDAAYEALAPFRWGGRSPFADGIFSHHGGRARLIPVVEPAPRIADPAFPLRLNTGRYRDQWHTMTRTGFSPKLSQHRPEPLVEVHPDDAVRHGLSDGGLARVKTGVGETVLRVRVTTEQARGAIFTPMHWSDAFAAGGRSNRLSERRSDPISGQPAFKDNAAAIAPVRPDWRAFHVAAGHVAAGHVAAGLPDAHALDGVLYWTKRRVEKGWLVELAGMGEPDLVGLLPDGDIVEAEDRAAGMRRVAIRDADGRLSAAQFVTREGGLPPRDWIAGQLGASGAAVAEWLAGRPAGPGRDCGATVCVCYEVGETTLVDAIVGRGLDSVAAIGDALRAGTNCGSCRPALAKLLAQHPAAMEAAE